MKKYPLLAALVFCASAASAGPEAEALRGRDAFSAHGLSLQRLLRAFLPAPEIRGARPAAGQLLGSFVMKDQLDAHRGMLHLALGRRDWDIGMALSRGVKGQYITFARPGTLRSLHVDQLQDLVGDGRTVDLGQGSVYRVRIEPDIFDPVRGSTLVLEPAAGGGQTHRMSTGDLLDAIRAKSYRFTLGGSEYWTLYGTDVDAPGAAWAGTRSLIFFLENGTDSKSWTVADETLVEEKGFGLALSGATAVLVKGKDGVLRIYSAK